MNFTDGGSIETSPKTAHDLLTDQRVNLVRIAAIASFYLVHLWHVSSTSLGPWSVSLMGLESNRPVSGEVHLSISVLCLGWLMQALAVHMFLAQQKVAPNMGVITTLGDLVWLTALLCLSTGPGGPMVAGYFLIIMISGIRFDLRLVRIATLGAMASYLVLLGVTRWPIGLIQKIELDPVPRYHQLMILLAFVFSGIVMGQVVRLAYNLCDMVNRTSTEDRP